MGTKLEIILKDIQDTENTSYDEVLRLASTIIGDGDIIYVFKITNTNKETDEKKTLEFQVSIIVNSIRIFQELNRKDKVSVLLCNLLTQELNDQEINNENEKAVLNIGVISKKLQYT